MPTITMKTKVFVCLCRCGGANLLVERSLGHVVDEWRKTFSKAGECITATFDTASAMRKCNGSCLGS
jgi:hypothetical protein